MMYNKALLFSDLKAAAAILGHSDPKIGKRLGRQVKNFDNLLVWAEHREEIVYAGNKYKFEQNPSLMRELMKTKGTTLVEASPFDRIWGIGLRATDPRAKIKKEWKGQNLLGLILTRLREDFMKETEGGRSSSSS